MTTGDEDRDKYEALLIAAVRFARAMGISHHDILEGLEEAHIAADLANRMDELQAEADATRH